MLSNKTSMQSGRLAAFPPRGILASVTQATPRSPQDKHRTRQHCTSKGWVVADAQLFPVGLAYLVLRLLLRRLKLHLVQQRRLILRSHGWGAWWRAAGSRQSQHASQATSKRERVTSSVVHDLPCCSPHAIAGLTVQG